MKRRSYPSDLTEDEWLLLEPLLPPPQRIGHPREVNLKEILNAIFYLKLFCDAVITVRY